MKIMHDSAAIKDPRILESLEVFVASISDEKVQTAAGIALLVEARIQKDKVSRN